VPIFYEFDGAVPAQEMVAEQAVSGQLSRTQIRRAQRQHTQQSYQSLKRKLVDVIKPQPKVAIQASDLEIFRTELHSIASKDTIHPGRAEHDIFPTGNDCGYCGAWTPLPSPERREHHTISVSGGTNTPHHPCPANGRAYGDNSLDLPLSALAELSFSSTEEASSEDFPEATIAEHVETCINLQPFEGQDIGDGTVGTTGFLDLPDLVQVASSAWSTYRIAHVLGLVTASGLNVSDTPETYQQSVPPRLLPDNGLCLSLEKAAVLESQRLAAHSDTSSSFVLPALFCNPSEPIPPVVLSNTECKQQ